MSTRAPDTLADLDAAGLHVPIVASRFNAEVVDVLVDGARGFLRARGIAEDDCPVLRVPGAFELPVVVARLAARDDVDGVVALGAVVRGGTPHFDYVCQAATIGLEAAARAHDTPVGFGLLTTDTWEQATARAGGEHGNKGREAAEALLETIHVLRSA